MSPGPRATLRVAARKVPITEPASSSRHNGNLTAAAARLRIAYPIRPLFEPLSEFLVGGSQFHVGPSDLPHLLSGIRVVEGLGSCRDFLSACSQVAGNQWNFSVPHWMLFPRPHDLTPTPW